MEIIFQLATAILASYRLANLIAKDEGPFHLFSFTRNEAKIINPQSQFWSSFWDSVSDGLECPCCVGFYTSVLCGLLILFPSMYGNIFLIIFAIAGGQYYMNGRCRND